MAHPGPPAGQPNTALSPSFLNLAAPPATAATTQTAPQLAMRQCTACRQPQPLAAFASRTILGVITKTCLNCRDRNRRAKQAQVRRSARSVSVASVATEESNATRFSDFANALDPQPEPAQSQAANLPSQLPPQQAPIPFPSHPYPQPLAPFQPHASQEPRPAATPPEHATTLTRGALDATLEDWLSKVKVRVQSWLDPLRQQVSSLKGDLANLARPQAATAAPTAHQARPTPPAASPFGHFPLGTPHPGEWSFLRLFPWVSSEIADAISLDRFTVSDLGKLRNPASSTASEETPTTVTVAGVQINVASASSTGPLKAFLKSIPDVNTFCQVWVVYVSLRAAASSDPALGPALSHFLVHVVDLDRSYPWANVAEYVMTVCQKRFGHADAAAWAVRDTEAFQDRLSLAPPRPTRTTIKPKSDETCWRWNNSTCTNSNCKFQHLCSTCRGKHNVKLCPSASRLPSVPNPSAKTNGKAGGKA